MSNRCFYQTFLDKAAKLISQGRYSIANGLLAQMEAEIAATRNILQQRMIRLRDAEDELQVSGKGNPQGYDASETINITLPKLLISELSDIFTLSIWIREMKLSLSVHLHTKNPKTVLI